jgi:hypothetical protein
VGNGVEEFVLEPVGSDLARLELLFVDADEGLEVVLDEAVERALLRSARLVDGERRSALG